MEEIRMPTGQGAELFKCVPTYYSSWPAWLRKAVGVASVLIFTWSFFISPIMMVYTLYMIIFKQYSWFSTVLYGLIVLSLCLPMKEWVDARKFPQLWYEIFDFSCNIEPSAIPEYVDKESHRQFMISMHPHGIIPFQAILWAGYCDQYLRSDATNTKLYGFGAAADILMYLPVLRNIMGWLSAGSASYKSIKDGLVEGKFPCVNAAGRKPKNLFILPGGVAEIFTSEPGVHKVVVKSRRGLMKISLETGALLMPTYVFGGTDFFHNFATSDSFISRFSRKMKMAIAIFWGKYYLPIPYFPKVSMCIGNPIYVEKWSGEGPVPKELIDDLNARYINSLTELFDKYKAAAGYPDAVLEIM